MRHISPREDDGAFHVELAADPAARPDQEALGADLRRMVRTLIRGLPRKLRDPLLLTASGNHSYEEAAAILGVPIGTAKWRVAEARRRLKAKLQALGYIR
jgi:RNA polymerase sigma-70 factor (ECF subfamily)